MISNNENSIDVRDIIARVEQLRDEREEYNDRMGDPNAWDMVDDGEPEELAGLESLLGELAGSGGDEEWGGEWYPVTLIRDSYFEEYAQELAEDIGAIDANAAWPNNCIDWCKAVRELQYDYSTVEFDAVTYWYR